MSVEKLMPKRISDQGRKPTVTGKSLTLPVNSKQKIKLIWQPQKDHFTKTEQRYLMAAALEMGVKAAFDLHIYTFGGKMFLQRSGGPTGKRMTCPAAKICINRWWRRVKKELFKLNLKIPLVFLYVDDFRVGITPIPFGYTYCPRYKKWNFSAELADAKLRSHLRKRLRMCF